MNRPKHILGTFLTPVLSLLFSLSLASCGGGVSLPSPPASNPTSSSDTDLTVTATIEASTSGSTSALVIAGLNKSQVSDQRTGDCLCSLYNQFAKVMETGPDAKGVASFAIANITTNLPSTVDLSAGVEMNWFINCTCNGATVVDCYDRKTVNSSSIGSTQEINGGCNTDSTVAFNTTFGGLALGENISNQFNGSTEGEEYKLQKTLLTQSDRSGAGSSSDVGNVREMIRGYLASVANTSVPPAQVRANIRAMAGGTADAETFSDMVGKAEGSTGLNFRDVAATAFQTFRTIKETFTTNLMGQATIRDRFTDQTSKENLVATMMAMGRSQIQTTFGNPTGFDVVGQQIAQATNYKPVNAAAYLASLGNLTNQCLNGCNDLIKAGGDLSGKIDCTNGVTGCLETYNNVKKSADALGGRTAVRENPQAVVTVAQAYTSCPTCATTDLAQTFQSAGTTTVFNSTALSCFQRMAQSRGNPSSCTSLLTPPTTPKAGSGSTTTETVTPHVETVIPLGVQSVSPLGGATDQAPTTTVSATFTEAMDGSTLNATTFTLTSSVNIPVSGTVSYNSSSKTATFTPSARLDNSMTYTARISTSAKNVAGNSLPSNVTWNFSVRSMQPAWTHSYNGAVNGDDQGTSVALGSDGSVYVTGFETTATNGTDMWTRKLDVNGDAVWTKTVDGTAHGADRGNGISIGSDGSVYVAGNQVVTGQSTNISLIRYNPNTGSVIQSQLVTSAGSAVDTGNGLALYSDDVFMIGSIAGGAQGANIWARDYSQFNPGGGGITIRWTMAPAYNNGSFNGADIGYGIAVDDFQTVYAVGTTAISGVDSDVWIRKFGPVPTGGTAFTRTYNNTSVNGVDEGRGIAISPDGMSIYVAGFTTSARGDTDALILQYSVGGNLMWVKTYDGPAGGNDDARAIVADPNGDGVYITGRTTVAGQSDDVWIAKYDAAGNAVWTKTYNGLANGSDIGQGITIDTSGNLYVTGFDTNIGTDVWVRKYTP